MIARRIFYFLFIINSLYCHTALSQNENTWLISSDKEWLESLSQSSNLEFTNGLATAKPNGKSGSYLSRLKKFEKKKSLKSIEVEQTNKWLNWKEISNVGPKNAEDAPVLLTVKDNDYWMFARYGRGEKNQLVVETLKIEEKVYMSKMSQAEGDAAIAKLKQQQSTQSKKGGGSADKDPNQTNGAGGQELGLGGYHAWHSSDMKNWVHQGPVSNYKSRWMTNAEYVDGKFYLYYDNPNHVTR